MKVKDFGIEQKQIERQKTVKRHSYVAEQKTVGEA
jgi:hypothetical protein